MIDLTNTLALQLLSQGHHPAIASGHESGGIMHWALFRILSGFLYSIGHRLAYASPLDVVIGIVVVLGVAVLVGAIIKAVRRPARSNGTRR